VSVDVGGITMTSNTGRPRKPESGSSRCCRPGRSAWWRQLSRPQHEVAPSPAGLW